MRKQRANHSEISSRQTKTHQRPKRRRLKNSLSRESISDPSETLATAPGNPVSFKQKTAIAKTALEAMQKR